MERPTMEDVLKVENSAAFTNEQILSNYTAILNDYIDFQQSEINRLKEEFIPPSDVEILLYSSSNEVYVNDDQRIGFQKGAKWMRKQLSQNKH